MIYIRQRDADTLQMPVPFDCCRRKSDMRVQLVRKKKRHRKFLTHVKKNNIQARTLGGWSQWSPLRGKRLVVPKRTILKR